MLLWKQKDAYPPNLFYLITTKDIAGHFLEHVSRK